MPGRHGKMARVFFKLAVLGILVILPFMVLIRGSVYLHEKYHFLPSLALIGGLSLTFVLLSIYVTFFYGRIYGHIGTAGSLKRRSVLILVVLLSYVAYGLIYLSNGNVKNPEVAREFLSLHPILRMGVSTVVLVDSKLVVTDANRLPEDYRSMGLNSKNHSLHYRQSSGYVHALDIRTHERSGIRNFLMKWYFRAMGFRVLRHYGTGDHLHISLMSHDRPGAY